MTLVFFEGKWENNNDDKRIFECHPMYLVRGIILLNSIYHILNVTTVDIVLNFVRTFFVHKTIIVNSSVYLYTTDLPLLETFFDGQNDKYVLLTVTCYYLQPREFLKQIRFFGDILD